MLIAHNYRNFGGMEPKKTTVIQTDHKNFGFTKPQKTTKD